MRATRGGILVLATSLAALAGCAGCDSVPEAAITDCDQQVAPGGAATDILFVVDDSGSMWEEQEALAANLGAFIDALANAPVRLDVRIGVTNTSIDSGYSGTPGYGTRITYGNESNGLPFPGVPGTPYPAGALVAVAHDPSGVATAGHFLWGMYDPTSVQSTWGGARILTNGPNLVRDFKANVLQGIWGSGKEQPLEAMKRALDQASCPGLNCGLQRAGARLAVVVLTDEDDCSSAPGTVSSDLDCRSSWSDPAPLTPIDTYVGFLASTAAFTQAGPPIFALIAGFDPDNANTSICRGSSFTPPTATAAEWAPSRLETFRARLEATSSGTQTLKRSICGSFGPALLQVASMIIPQTVPLEKAPEDWRMLAVGVNRGGALVSCPLALEGSSGEGTAGVVFIPPQAGEPAKLRFQGTCLLGVGDRVDISVICAR